jgi:hypothetical protein
MIRRLLLLATLAMSTSLCMAEAAKPFVGKWNVEWQTEKQTYEAVMVITETGGTWQTSTRRRSNPCFGREVPIQHDNATPNSLDMTLKFSDIIFDCKNATVKLQLDDKGAVVGRRGNAELQLKRD